MSNITIIKSKLNRGLELTQQESWELYKYIQILLLGQKHIRNGNHIWLQGYGIMNKN